MSAVRALGRLLGLGRDDPTSITWEVAHPYGGPVEPQVLNLVLPDVEGAVRVSVTLEDARTGAVASGTRVVELKHPRRQ